MSVFNKECPALTLGRMTGLVLVGVKVKTSGQRVSVKPGSSRMIPKREAVERQQGKRCRGTYLSGVDMTNSVNTVI